MIRELAKKVYRTCMVVLLSVVTTAAVIFLRTVYAANAGTNVDDVGVFDAASFYLGASYVIMATILPGFAWFVGRGSRRAALELMRDLALWLLVTAVFSTIALYLPIQFITRYGGIYYRTSGPIANSVITAVVFMLVPIVFYVARFLIIVGANYSDSDPDEDEDPYPKNLNYTAAEVRAYLATYVHTAAYAGTNTHTPALKVDDDEGTHVQE